MGSVWATPDRYCRAVGIHRGSGFGRHSNGPRGRLGPIGVSGL